jgi:predicted Zn-dependent protease with MMP-like domain
VCRFAGAPRPRLTDLHMLCRSAALPGSAAAYAGVVGEDRHGRAARVDSDRRRRPSEGFRVASTKRFRHLVEDTLSTLPDALLDAVADAHLEIAELPPATIVVDAGLTEIPLARFEPHARPPRLTVYRRPVELRALGRADLIELLRSAVGHEIARALGLPDDDLDDDWD